MGTIASGFQLTVPVGSVISQSPGAGTLVALGTPVNLVVSSGPAPVNVPNVVNTTQAAATSTLGGVGLLAGAVSNAFSATVPVGSVISQAPVAGTPVQPGSRVDLVVSSGSYEMAVVVDKVVFSDGTGARTTAAFSTAAPGEVLFVFRPSAGWSRGRPDLDGLRSGRAHARATRRRAGWDVRDWRATAASVLTNVTVTSAQSTDGYHQSLTVVAFRGAAGSGASAGASGSTGAPTLTLTTTQPGSVVYAVGNDWDNAIARTLPGNQAMIHRCFLPPVGDTMWVQNRIGSIPGAGTAVQMNATGPTTDRWNLAAVEILAALPGTGTVPVPNVVNQTQAAATALITAPGVGLVVGTVTTGASATVPSGSGHQSESGRRHTGRVGNARDLVVSSGPAPVNVPNVVNTTQAAATSTLGGVGLLVGAVSNAFSATVPVGSVIASETPVAGTPVQPGSRVDSRRLLRLLRDGRRR